MNYGFLATAKSNFVYQQFLLEETQIKNRLGSVNLDNVVNELKDGLSGAESLLDITRAGWAKVTVLAEDTSTITAIDDKKIFLKKMIIAYVTAHRKEYKENNLAIDTAIEAVIAEAGSTCCCCVIL